MAWFVTAMHNRMVALASELQVLHANLRGLHDIHSGHRTHPTTHEVETVCFRVVHAYGMVDVLYNYARGTREFDDDLGTAVWNAAELLHFGSDPNMQYVRDLVAAHFGPAPETNRAVLAGLTVAPDGTGSRSPPSPEGSFEPRG